MDKEFITANELFRDAFLLGRQVLDSGYRPEVLLAMWRGGTPVGIAVHEFLRYKGVDTQHFAVKAHSYTGIGQAGDVHIEPIDPLLNTLHDNCMILLVDDIFDTGRTMQRMIERLSVRTNQVRIATIFYKPGCCTTPLRPDFYVKETSRWIVFPHELMGLTLEEIRHHKPEIAQCLPA